MHPITVLPDVTLQSNDPITTQFLQRNITTFHSACQWVKDLPYAANANSEDSIILFEDGFGNCTTKHGAILLSLRSCTSKLERFNFQTINLP